MVNPSGRTILLTGGNGFIGHHLLNALCQHRVNIRSVLRTGADPQRSKLMDNVEYVYSDNIFSEPKTWWRAICSGVDIIIHAAWYVKPASYLNAMENLECLAGSISMLDAAIEMKVKRFVGLGTCFEYQQSTRPLSVDSTLDPQSLYATTKATLYQTLKSTSEIMCFDYIWCRLFYLYGEGEHRSRLVPYIHNKLKNGEKVEIRSPEKIRDYLAVEDAAKEIVTLALGDESGPKNICSGKGISIKELAEEIAQEYGRPELLVIYTDEDNNNDADYIVGLKKT